MFPEFVSYVDENWIWNVHIAVCGYTRCRIQIMTSVAAFCQYHIDFKCKDGFCSRSVVYSVWMGIHKFVPHLKLCTWLFSMGDTMCKEKIHLKTDKKYHQSFRMILLHDINRIINYWIENILLYLPFPLMCTVLGVTFFFFPVRVN